MFFVATKPMNTLGKCLLFAFFGIGAQLGLAQTAEIKTELNQPRLQGQGRLSVWGFNVYDAKLWVEPGFSANAALADAAALEIQYLRGLRGQAIAERSLEEMRRQGPISEAQAASWLAFMRQTFPDVGKGDRITGVFKPDQGIKFFKNNRAIGESKDLAFAKRFAGIWLSPQTSAPGLRTQLLGRPETTPPASKANSS
jgi:Chalcone isomerase-like